MSPLLSAAPAVVLVHLLWLLPHVGLLTAVILAALSALRSVFTAPLVPSTAGVALLLTVVALLLGLTTALVGLSTVLSGLLVELLRLLPVTSLPPVLLVPSLLVSSPPSALLLTTLLATSSALLVAGLPLFRLLTVVLLPVSVLLLLSTPRAALLALPAPLEAALQFFGRFERLSSTAFRVLAVPVLRRVVLTALPVLPRVSLTLLFQPFLSRVWVSSAHG